VQTNIVMARLAKSFMSAEVLSRLQQAGIKAYYSCPIQSASSFTGIFGTTISHELSMSCEPSLPNVRRPSRNRYPTLFEVFLA
jgi:hypothetical protein